MLTFSTFGGRFYHTLRHCLDCCARYAAARLPHNTCDLSSLDALRSGVLTVGFLEHSLGSRLSALYTLCKTKYRDMLHIGLCANKPCTVTVKFTGYLARSGSGSGAPLIIMFYFVLSFVIVNLLI